MNGAASEELNPTQWVAVISLFSVLTVPLAVLLAAWCKRRYGRAVVALQRASAAAAPDTGAIVDAEDPRADAPAPTPLDIEWTTLASSAGTASAAFTPARRVRRRVLIAQAVLGTGLWFALLLTAIVAVAYAGTVSEDVADAVAGDGSAPSPWATLTLWGLLLTPPALAWAFQAGWRESHLWIAVALCFALLLGGTVASGSEPVASAATLGVAALIGLMLLAFMRPQLRGAGPPLVMALIAGMAVFWVIGAILAYFDDGDADAPLTAADWWEFALLAPPVLAFSAWCGWRLLLRLARRYGEKRFSDVALAHSAYWSLIAAFTASATLLLSFEEATGGTMEWAALAVFLLWAAWRALQRVLVRWLTRSAPPQGPALLLLRVFKPSARSESFIDRLLARWRFAGPTWMIAGPDLAGAFMEPDEFFLWLRRRLRERFVARADEVPQRIAALDNARDPDGRFRVSELFCTDDTWKPVVLDLMERADAVLLDLREFTPDRAGTHYELVQLLRRAELAKVRVLVDAREPREPIEATLRSAWTQARRPPVAGQPAPQLVVLQLDESRDAQVNALARVLAEAATRPASVVPH